MSVRVLLIDDNLDLRHLVQNMIEEWGYDVASFSTGEAGVYYAMDAAPCVAIIDLALPGISGFEVAERIRAERGPAMQLIAHTGYHTECVRKRCQASGFDQFLLKPALPETFQRLLQAAAD